jgi:hypothetical protein
MPNARLTTLLSPPTARSAALLSPGGSNPEFEYDEDPRSLLTKVTGPIIGAVGAVGNFLDLPGSMVRDTLTGNNPFDQLLTPFSSEDRVTGRDLLTTWGLTNPNKETGISGWFDDPMEGVSDIGGFLAETALDPLNMLSRPLKAASLAADGAKAGRAGRGLINNTFDPLQLSEAGEKLGVRSQLDEIGSRVAGGEGLIRRGMDRTSKTMTGVADAIKKAPGIGNPFSHAQSAMNYATSTMGRVAKSMFDATVRGTTEAIVQPLMRKFSGVRHLDEDIARADGMRASNEMNQALKTEHGDGILDDLDAGTSEVDAKFADATTMGDSLFDPIGEHLQSLGYSDTQISKLSDSFLELTRSEKTIGVQFNSLYGWLSDLKGKHVDLKSGAIPDPEALEKFRLTGHKGGLYEELGWKREASKDLYNETLGIRIGRTSEKGNWSVITDEGAELGKKKSQADAIALAHNHARDEAKSFAQHDFDDVSNDWVKSFQEHDKAVHASLKASQSDLLRKDHYMLNNEIRAAAEGVEDFDYHLLTTPELRDIAGSLRSAKDKILEMQRRGFLTGPANDPAGIKHVSRRQGDLSKAEFEAARGEGEGIFESGARQVLESGTASMTHEDPAYIGWRKGSAAINRYYRDPELAETINSVNQEFLAGEFKGQLAASQVDNIRETLANVSLGDGTAERLLDDLIDPKRGTIDLQKLNNKLSGFAEKVGQQPHGAVNRLDNVATKKWAIGGKGRQFHLFDNVLATKNGEDFVTNQVKRVGKEETFDLDVHKDYESLTHASARQEVMAGDSQLQPKAVARIKEAEEAGLPVFVKRDPNSGVAVEIITPNTVDTIQAKLTTQLRNLGKKFSADSTPDMDTLEALQRKRVTDFTRLRYGDEIIDEMPRYNELTKKRQAKDYRDGKDGEKIELTEAEYKRLEEDELVTTDPDAADGLVLQLTDSRIDKAIVPKLFSPDGGYAAYRKNGVFSNDPFLDKIDGQLSLDTAINKADVFEEFVQHFVRAANRDSSLVYPRLADANAEVGEYAIDTLMESQKGAVGKNKFLEYLAKKNNTSLADPKNAADLAEEVGRLRRVKINSADWKDFAGGLDMNRASLLDMPGIGSVVKFVDSMTKLFKVGVLAWPGRISRDFTSATYRAIESGMVDVSRPGRALNSMKMGNAVATGKHMEGFTELLQTAPEFRKAFDASPYPRMIGTAEEIAAGKKMSESQAVFDFFREEFSIAQGGAYHHTSMDASDPLFDANAAGTLEPLRKAVPDFKGKQLPGHLISTAKEGIKKHGIGASLNPFNNQGIPHLLTSNKKLRGKTRSETTWTPGLLAEQAGGYTDGITRATAVIDQMRRGTSFKDAMGRARDTLVDYDPRRFSNFEKEVMKRVFPFYSFLSSQVPYVIKELMNNPSGGLGKTIRAQRHGQDEEYVPYHMRDKAAIPWGTDAEGNQTYLASLGLMHEDAVAMLNPDLSDILGKMNPLLKAPVELATGRSLFMKGPLGGRDLSELDPTIGRIRQRAGEATGLLEPTNRRPDPFISTTVEHLLSNSPAARLLSSTRTLLDNRKSYSQRAVNLLLGPKFTTISPQQQQSMLRNEFDAVMKKNGIPPFTRYSLRKGEIQQIEDSGDKTLAYQMRAVEKARAILDKAQKQRRESE